MEEFSLTFSVAGFLDCKICPVGYYCTSGSHTPIPCPSGTYNPVLMQGSLADCRQCSAGMACPQDGLHWPSEVCSAGHYCPAGSRQPNATSNACPAGTYTDYHNLTASRECSSCPLGQACAAGTGGRQKPPQLCATGLFDKLPLFCPKSIRIISASIGGLQIFLFYKALGDVSSG